MPGPWFSNESVYIIIVNTDYEKICATSPSKLLEQREKREITKINSTESDQRFYTNAQKNEIKTCIIFSLSF